MSIYHLIIAIAALLIAGITLHSPDYGDNYRVNLISHSATAWITVE